MNLQYIEHAVEKLLEFYTCIWKYVCIYHNFDATSGSHWDKDAVCLCMLPLDIMYKLLLPS